MPRVGTSAQPSPKRPTPMPLLSERRFYRSCCFAHLPPPKVLLRQRDGGYVAVGRSEMGTALAARLGLGLLLLALLLPTQTGGENSTSANPLHSNPNSTSLPLSTLNHTNSNTTKGHGNALQSATGLLIFSLSLLYIC
ncbi:signal transducer CD24 [Sphaerodactylus townsendi]|uniref:signal transducer CD24 n=1 Tax=Sphaerodactylus townsendi TaxID=933632 RepID=UPI0020272BCA|nr:signal transducer CD24 [Sphaerodactylus townsendi]